MELLLVYANEMWAHTFACRFLEDQFFRGPIVLSDVNDLTVSVIITCASLLYIFLYYTQINAKIFENQNQFLRKQQNCKKPSSRRASQKHDMRESPLIPNCQVSPCTP